MCLFATALRKVEISSTKTRLGISTYISNSAEISRNKLDKNTNIWYNNNSDILFEVKREKYYSQVNSPMPGYNSQCLYCTTSSCAIGFVVVCELCSACFSTVCSQ
jgi:hypothetical protein